MTHLRSPIGIVCTAALLTACGRGSSAFLPAGGSSGEAASAPARAVSVRFVMHWPKHRTKAYGMRGPAWISPSTASVIVEIEGSGSSNVTFANAPPSGTQSTVQIAAPPGRDTFTISLYDQPQRAGEKSPKGNELGQATVIHRIHGGRSNVVNATIAGIAAGTTLEPAANQPLVESTNGGYTLVGDTPQIFLVTAVDADGNIIVPQPHVSLTAPKYQEGSIGGGLTLTYFNVTPVRTKPGEFSVSASQSDRTDLGGAFYIKLSLTASARDAIGNRVSVSVPMWQSSAFYVLYAKAPRGASRVALYDAAGNLVQLGSGAFAELQKPVGIAYDTARRHVIVADRGAQRIFAFDGAGRPVRRFGPVLLDQDFEPTSLVFDPNLHVIYASAQTQIQAFTSSGTNVAVGSGGGFYNTYPYGPVAYVYGSNEIIVAGAGANTVDTYDESGTYLNETSTFPVTDVTAVAGDPSSNDEFAAGTPEASGGYTVFQTYPGSDYNPRTSAALADPLALGVDPISRELYVLSGTPNQLTPVYYNTIGVQFGTVDSAHVIPANASYAGPLGLAVTF